MSAVGRADLADRAPRALFPIVQLGPRPRFLAARQPPRTCAAMGQTQFCSLRLKPSRGGTGGNIISVCSRSRQAAPHVNAWWLRIRCGNSVSKNAIGGRGAAPNRALATRNAAQHQPQTSHRSARRRKTLKSLKRTRLTPLPQCVSKSAAGGLARSRVRFTLIQPCLSEFRSARAELHAGIESVAR
jgi:hypothetical protein